MNHFNDYVFYILYFLLLCSIAHETVFYKIKIKNKFTSNQLVRGVVAWRRWLDITSMYIGASINVHKSKIYNKIKMKSCFVIEIQLKEHHNHDDDDDIDEETFFDMKFKADKKRIYKTFCITTWTRRHWGRPLMKIFNMSWIFHEYVLHLNGLYLCFWICVFIYAEGLHNSPLFLKIDWWLNDKSDIRIVRFELDISFSNTLYRYSISWYWKYTKGFSYG